jgi:hypothetical protein
MAHLAVLRLREGVHRRFESLLSASRSQRDAVGVKVLV